MTAVAPNDPDVFSKSEFARRRGVTLGHLSQWLSEGKIHGEAIVGVGRNAQTPGVISVLGSVKDEEIARLSFHDPRGACSRTSERWD